MLVSSRLRWWTDQKAPGSGRLPGHDERTGDTQDFGTAEWRFERRGERIHPVHQVQVGGMARLDRDDRAGGIEQIDILDRRSGAVIRRDTGVFQRGSDGDESGGVGVAEVIAGFLHRRATEVGDGGNERVHMGAFVIAHEDQVVVNTGVEVAGGETSQSVPVECVFEMLKGEGVIQDIDILNYALTLEHLEYAFYRDGLAGFTSSNFDTGVYDNLILVRDHEGAHVDALVSTITNLGGTPVQEASYDFGYANAAGFIAVAAALENTGVSAYDGAGAAIQNVDLLNAAGSIVAVEARHASYLNLMNGMDPFPAAFETPLSRAEVLGIAGPAPSYAET